MLYNTLLCTSLYNMLNRLVILQGGIKVILELSNKNCDHGSHIRKVQLRKASRLKLRFYNM